MKLTSVYDVLEDFRWNHGYQISLDFLIILSLIIDLLIVKSN